MRHILSQPMWLTIIRMNDLYIVWPIIIIIGGHTVEYETMQFFSESKGNIATFFAAAALAALLSQSLDCNRGKWNKSPSWLVRSALFN